MFFFLRAMALRCDPSPAALPRGSNRWSVCHPWPKSASAIFRYLGRMNIECITWLYDKNIKNWWKMAAQCCPSPADGGYGKYGGPRRFRPTAARATRARVRVRVRAWEGTHQLQLWEHFCPIIRISLLHLMRWIGCLKSRTLLPLLHGNTISALPTWVARTAPATAAPKATPHGPMITAWEAKMPSSPLKSIEPKNQWKSENHLKQTSMTLGSNRKNLHKTRYMHRCIGDAGSICFGIL